MFDTFLSNLSTMMVLFTCIVFGYVLNKKKLCPENTANVLSKLETTALVPALAISTMMNNCTVETLKADYKTVIYASLILAIALCIAIPLSKAFVKEGYVRNVYKYALTFGNYGFVGNALVLAIMGDVGLYQYMLFSVPLGIVVYAWGFPILTQGDAKTNLLKKIFNPGIVYTIIGMFLGLTGMGKYLPHFAVNTMSQLGACMGPIAMILTGFVVADYDFISIIKNKKVYAATLLRLIILPLLFIVILKFTGANKAIAYFCVCAFGSPLGLNTVVFPASVGGDTSTGASMAMISHTLCIITIPLMFALINILF